MWIHTWNTSTSKRGLVVWQCLSLCGGAGDRVKGLVSAFIDAARFNADFRIRWMYPDDISFILESSFRYTRHVRTEPIMNVHSIDRPYSACRWRDVLSSGGVVYINTNMFANDRDRCQGEFPFLNAWPDRKTMHDVFHFLFRPRPSILTASYHNCQRCVHVRMGDKSFQRDRDTVSSDVVSSIKNHAWRSPNSSCTYVATDSDALRRQLMPDFHVDSFIPKHVDKGGGRHGMWTTWSTVFALARCKELFQLRRSGFSDLAAAIAGDAMSFQRSA